MMRPTQGNVILLPRSRLCAVVQGMEQGMFGDTLFAFGALVLGWFVLGLITGHSFDRTATLDEGEYSPRPVGVKVEEEVTVGH